MFAGLKKKLQEKDARGKIRPRRPVVAALLSVCPGMGQHYAGHLQRGIAMYIALIVVSWLAAIAFMHIESRISIILLAVPFVGVAAIALDAYRLAKNQPESYRLRWSNRVVIYAGVFVFLLATVNPLMDMLVGRSIVRAFVMNSNGMSPTILPRDLVLINKLAAPKRGDVALIQFGQEKKSAQLTHVMEEQLIKRIIAGPGDTIEIRGREVKVNGYKLDEPYAHHGSGGTAAMSVGADSYAYGPKEVPPASYFVMGDNRDVRFDSRIFGFVAREKMVGKVTKVFWSWNLDRGGIRWDRTAMALE